MEELSLEFGSVLSVSAGLQMCQGNYKCFSFLRNNLNLAETENPSRQLSLIKTRLASNCLESFSTLDINVCCARHRVPLNRVGILDLVTKRL